MWGEVWGRTVRRESREEREEEGRNKHSHTHSAITPVSSVELLLHCESWFGIGP